MVCISLLLLLLCCSGTYGIDLNVDAITLDTRKWNKDHDVIPRNSEECVTTFNSLPRESHYARGPRALAEFDTINGVTVNNRGYFGAILRDIAYFHRFDFTAPEKGVLKFRLGADYSHGGTLRLDNADVFFSDQAVQWANDWGDALTFEKEIEAGPHVIESYGFADCCDGAQKAQYAFQTDLFQTWTDADVPGGVPVAGNSLRKERIVPPQTPLSSATEKCRKENLANGRLLAFS